jgi:hypothetical protein
MTAVWHITHLDNLASIIATGALRCERRVRQQARQPRSIAYGHIKQRREQTGVGMPPYGTLSDYVPFYFCPRSPMLYAIHRGFVPASGGQNAIVHLEFDAEAILAAGVACVYTDGNAASQPLAFHDPRQGFAALSWDVIRSERWHDTADDNDRKRRKQAEFLARDEVPWRLAVRLGVFDNGAVLAVQKALSGALHQPAVECRPDWYYR